MMLLRLQQEVHVAVVVEGDADAVLAHRLHLWNRKTLSRRGPSANASAAAAPAFVSEIGAAARPDDPLDPAATAEPKGADETHETPVSEPPVVVPLAAVSSSSSEAPATVEPRVTRSQSSSKAPSEAGSNSHRAGKKNKKPKHDSKTGEVAVGSANESGEGSSSHPEEHAADAGHSEAQITLQGHYNRCWRAGKRADHLMSMSANDVPGKFEQYSLTVASSAKRRADIEAQAKEANIELVTGDDCVSTFSWAGPGAS